MAEELRQIFNETFIEKLSTAIKREYDLFDKDEFRTRIFQDDWKSLVLKQRMRKMTVCLHEQLPQEYGEALKILAGAAPQFTGLGGILFPDYVEQYGLEKWDESMCALKYFTTFSTSEFAVRPFLLKDGKKMLDQMLKWSIDPDEHVRRLASEGSRPRLPWGLAVPLLKQNPEQTLPILANLKEDGSLYVRKSVANHLNDISYINPDIVLNIAKEWYGKNNNTDWIIRHACRSLLKKGNKQALLLFGYIDDTAIKIEQLNIERDPIFIGDSIQFSFMMASEKSLKVRVEYGIDYVKARGQRNRKVFMLKGIDMKKGDKTLITRRHSFKDLTTRKHYKGTHTLSIIVNGAVKASIDFKIE
ncbi:DNA alkylation repair protein [Metabacillus idriensis]|uniref:DNA alkylation repair protein n=1 Tax=Metabacillus idriensis TaxID=324768 RepID=UPI0017490C3E|nr:DNA alkylation repair protein [Metabacillus idriensis]